MTVYRPLYKKAACSKGDTGTVLNNFSRIFACFKKMKNSRIFMNFATQTNEFLNYDSIYI